MRPSGLRATSWLRHVPLLLSIIGATGRICAARDYVDRHDDGETKWSVSCEKAKVRLTRHLRTAEVRREGQAAELLEVAVAAPDTTLKLSYELPPALLIEDLKLSLWFQSNQDGATLGVRVVFPNQTDPATDAALTIIVEGDAYTKAGQWQKLECTHIDRGLRRLLPQIRRRLQDSAGLKENLDLHGLYVDAAMINIRTSRGTSQFAIDTLRYEGIADASSGSGIRQVEHALPVVDPEAVFHNDRLLVDGQPFVPRIIPYRGEQPNDLARMHLNVVWVPDSQDLPLLDNLNRMGLRVMAVPPQAQADDGQELDPTSVHLAPFGPDSAKILFWYLGTHIPPDRKKEVMAWLEQIRNSDRVFKRPRPLMGDVSGLERTYSLQLSIVSASRSPVHTSFGFKNYRDWLLERRNLAIPGSFMSTWIQTEASPAVETVRQSAGWNPQVVEPEQLRLEVYAALAAGCRSLAFWTHSSLDDERPGALERKLTLAQLNMELELLEPLLASGSVSGQTPFSVQIPPARSTKGARSPLAAAKGQRMQEAVLNDREIQLRKQDQLKRDLEAVVIRTGLGILVLPIWYADEAQYVPGQMAANDARIVVPGVGESARAWEISTTRIHELVSKRTSGGKEVTLEKFDMTSAILFTDGESPIEGLRRKMETLSEASARVALELARAKFERVADVNLELHKLGMGQPGAGSILSAAKDLLARAETEFRAQRFHDSRLESANAMQHLRNLQYIYWSDAVRRMYAPVTSPHTLCFQTLPDHWRMIARFGRARLEGSRNVLRSGDFEDLDTMVAEGWQRRETAIDGIRSTAELNARAHQGAYALRLAAAPTSGKDPPASIAERPVTVVSPPVTVYKGQLVYIGGWVKVDAPSLGNLDGALFYDSLGGASAALRWRTVADWKEFEVVREVPETTELTLTMALSGLGEIRFDDLRIIPLDVDSPPAANMIKNTPGAGRTGPFDFLRRLPGFRGKTDPD